MEGDEEKAAIKEEEEALLLNGRATKVALGFVNEKHSRVIDEQLEKRARERERESRRRGTRKEPLSLSTPRQAKAKGVVGRASRSHAPIATIEVDEGGSH